MDLVAGARGTRLVSLLQKMLNGATHCLFAATRVSCIRWVDHRCSLAGAVFWVELHLPLLLVVLLSLRRNMLTSDSKNV